MAGTSAFGNTSTSVSITTTGRGVLQRGYDAVSHFWDLMKAGWVGYPSMVKQPSCSLHPALASVLTMEVAAKAAYLVMASHKLSQRSAARLLRLSRSVDNWDGEGAKQMTISALANFVGFLEKSPNVPSAIDIFLGFYGEIVTSWKLHDGSTLDMSFGEHQIELATDEHDEIFPIGDSDLYRLIAEL